MLNNKTNYNIELNINVQENLDFSKELRENFETDYLVQLKGSIYYILWF